MDIYVPVLDVKLVCQTKQLQRDAGEDYSGPPLAEKFVRPAHLIHPWQRQRRHCDQPDSAPSCDAAVLECFVCRVNPAFMEVVSASPHAQPTEKRANGLHQIEEGGVPASASVR